MGLRRRGVDVVTAAEVGRCGFSDREQLDWATAQRRVVVTFDDDFLVLADSGVTHSGIAYAFATKYTVGQLIHVLLLVHDVLTPEDMQNHVEFL
ncbi:MAG: DUF5615 family PIN-like protein [Planctomycetes bacterium]|nr:DUF5615 family PIN-like protein [Planctomycetota bacterium]